MSQQLKLSKADLKYFIQYTNLTRRQIEQTAKIFYKMVYGYDEPDGKLSRSIFIQMLATFNKLEKYDYTLVDPRWRLVLTLVDALKMTRIDLRVFMLCVAIYKSEDNDQEQLTYVFRIMDEERKGKLSKADFKLALEVVVRSEFLAADRGALKNIFKSKAATPETKKKDKLGLLKKEDSKVALAPKKEGGEKEAALAATPGTPAPESAEKTLTTTTTPALTTETSQEATLAKKSTASRFQNLKSLFNNILFLDDSKKTPAEIADEHHAKTLTKDEFVLKLLESSQYYY